MRGLDRASIALANKSWQRRNSYGEVDGPPNSGLPESGFSRASRIDSHRLLQPAGDGRGRVVLDQTNRNMR